MNDLRKNLSAQIIEQLNLEDVEIDDIDINEPLFGTGLGLDSIDALEIIVLLDEKYEIKITDPEEGREIFYSIETLATFIEKNRKT